MRKVEEYLELFARSHQAIGKNLDERAVRKIRQFTKLLRRWNSKYNLTGSSHGECLVLRHVVDSLSLAPLLQVEGAFQLGKDTRILDVGSGAGLPGVILSIALPKYYFTSVEPVGCKIAFQHHIVSQLNLGNYFIGQGPNVSCFSGIRIIISRAFARIVTVMKVAGNLTLKNPLIVLLKGSCPYSEIKTLVREMRVSSVSVLRHKILSLSKRRHIVTIKSGPSLI